MNPGSRTTSSFLIPQRGEIQVFENPESVAEAAAELFVSTAAHATAERGRFLVSMSGGSTPKRTFQLLATPKFSHHIDWAHVHIFFGDERYVPLDDASSNYRMTAEALLSHVSIPSANIHPVRTNVAPAEAAAAAYEEEIRSTFHTPGIPQFDLIYLGLGTNGHTASLFPHSPILHEQTRLVAADFVTEVNMWRISMTAPLLNAGRTVAFLIAGEDKAEVVHEVIAGPRDTERLPAQLIAPEGKLLWLVDKGAAGRLTSAQHGDSNDHAEAS